MIWILHCTYLKTMTLWGTETLYDELLYCFQFVWCSRSLLTMMHNDLRQWLVLLRRTVELFCVLVLLLLVTVITSPNLYLGAYTWIYSYSQIQLGCQFRYSNRSNDVTKQTRSYPVQVTFGNQTHRCMFGRGWNQPGQGPITPVASGSDCCREEWLRCCGPTSAGAQRRWTFSALIQAHARGDLQDRFSSFFFHFLSQLLRSSLETPSHGFAFNASECCSGYLRSVRSVISNPNEGQLVQFSNFWANAFRCSFTLLLYICQYRKIECQLQDFCSQM
jgi:hypothetical protein